MEKIIKDGSTLLKTIIKNYSDVASISRPSSARIITNKNSLLIESKWSLSDLQRRKKISLARTYIVKSADGKGDISGVSHQIPSCFTAYDYNTNLSAVVKVEDENSEEKQYLQIWKDGNLLYTMDVSKCKDHGVIHANDGACGLQWSGNHLLYLAEAKREVESFFKEPVDSCQFELTDKMGNEFEWQESWGEVATKLKHPQICYLDVTDFKITVKDSQKNVSALQAIWGPNQEIVYVGFDEEPYKLGIYACTNRKSAIYSCSMTTDSDEHSTVISAKNMHVRSPRFDPLKKYLVYFQNEANKTHRQCSQLVLYDWELKQNKILVDIVYDAKDNEFPGIFTDQLPERCFTSDGSYIIFSTLWCEKEKVIAVNLKTGSVIDLCEGSVPPNMIVLDVYMDKIIAAADSFNIKPCLMIGHLKVSENQLTVEWEYLDSNAPERLPDVDFSVHCYEPVLKNSSYPNLKSQLILLYSKTVNSIDQDHPLIIYPHGGPHSCYSISFIPRFIGLAKLGFVVCLVNYRGSIGFGENSIKSLTGNIGTQDVSDVHQSISEAQQLMKKLGISYSGEVFLMGGSHGGFLSAALCGRYPGEFAACVLINPVVDLVSMTTETDIPDWNFVESGLTFSYRYPSLEEKIEMFNMSPFKYIEHVTTPTLLCLGSKDLRVPHCQGLSYYKALKSQNVETRLCMYPNDGHALDSVAGSSDVFVQKAAWLFSHMKGKGEGSAIP